jgi:RNA polymerase sigma-70 factor (ECF subfamily)
MNQTDKLDAESVLAHLGWVRSLALQVAGHRISSDDVAQETWLRVLRNPPPQGVSLHDWISGTARKVAVELSRQSHRRKERETMAAKAARSESEGQTVRQVELERSVVDSVMELKEPLRRTILSRYFENMSAREIAAQDDIPVSTVNTRLSTAYATLRQRLTKQPDSVAGAFFCVALEGSAKGVSSLTFPAGTFASKPAALVAAALAAAGAGLFATRSSPAPASPVVPTTIAAQAPEPTVEVEPIVTAPSATDNVASQAGRVEALAAGLSASQGPKTGGQPAAATPQFTETLSVRVVDYLGQPVADAPFAVSVDGGILVRSKRVLSRTGPAGEAVEVDWSSIRPAGATAETEIKLAAKGIGFSPSPQTFRLDELPAGTIDLVIAEPFDTVILECVDDQGIALQEDVNVMAMGGRTMTLDALSETLIAAGRSERFFPVSLKETATFMGRAKIGYGASMANLPPRTVHRATTHLQLEFSGRLPSLTYRIPEADAATMKRRGRWSIQFLPEGAAESHRQARPWTADDIEFGVTFKDPSLAGQSGALSIGWSPYTASLADGTDRSVARSTSIDVTLSPVGESLALGEIQLEAAGEASQGRVVDSEGLPVKGARISLLEWKSKHGALGWHRDTGHRARSDSDGYFPAPSPLEPGTFALLAEHKMVLSSVPVPWAPMDKDVQLVLEPAAVVTGRVILPSSGDSTHFWVQSVEPSNGSARVISTPLDDDGSFSLHSVTGETTSLELVAPRSAFPIARLESVRVGGDEADPRIQPWDLGDQLRTLSVGIVSEEGEPIPFATLRTQGRKFYGRGGKASLLVQDIDGLITIQAPSCREFSCRLPELPDAVTLRPAFEVDLVIHGGPKVGPRLDSLVVSLKRTGQRSPEERSKLRGDEWTRDSSKSMSPRRLSIENGGETRVTCHQPGEYRLDFREKFGKKNRAIDQATLPEELQEARIIVEDAEGVQTFRFDWP